MKKIITQVQYEHYFWKGLPSSTRQKLNNWIEIANPDIDCMIPFPIAKIIDAAEHVFNIGRFDDEESADEVSVSEDSDSSEDSDYDSDSESDSSSDEEETSKKKKKKKDVKDGKKKKSKMMKKTKEKSSTTVPTTTTKSEPKIDEVSDLINKLQKMNINDPGYTSLYFWIT